MLAHNCLEFLTMCFIVSQETLHPGLLGVDLGQGSPSVHPPVLEKRPCIYQFSPHFPQKMWGCPSNIFDKSTPVPGLIQPTFLHSAVQGYLFVPFSQTRSLTKSFVVLHMVTVICYLLATVCVATFDIKNNNKISVLITC